MPESNPASDRTLHRWVVGFDGSPSSDDALAWALQHAPGRTNHVDVITAWQAPLSTPPPSSAISTDATNQAFRDAAQHNAANALAVARETLGNDGDVDVDTTCIYGGASAVLLHEAEQSDLLVLGNRGNGGFTRLLLGSTSNQCATHATAPTAIIRGNTPRSTERIVVGVDGSDNAMAALEWALDFASPGSHVRAIWVWDVSPLAVGADQFFFPEAASLAKDSLKELVDGYEPAAAEGGLTMTYEFMEGSPRSVLADQCAESDLIVMGMRGHGAIGAALLGSVSSWMVHHAERPIVVVPGH